MKRLTRKLPKAIQWLQNPSSILSRQSFAPPTSAFGFTSKIQVAKPVGRKTVLGASVVGHRLILTPALSLGEREQAGPPLHDNRAAAFATRRTTILPLPKGEGRGEGEKGGRPFSSFDPGLAPRPIFIPRDAPTAPGILSDFGFRASDFFRISDFGFRISPLTLLPRLIRLVALVCLIGLGCAPSAWSANTLQWRADQNRVNADISDWDVHKLLEEIATATGWEVFIEPGTKYTVSTKFKNLSPGEALRMLLPSLTAVLLPQPGGPSKLLVYRTSAQEATQWVRPIAAKKEDPTAKPISNELVVTLKPGAKIDELAKKLGAKVVGRADGLNTYRLAFENAEAAESAREQLRNNPDVVSVDSNYWMHGPESPDALALSSGNPLNLKESKSGDCTSSIIGLIDTPVQSTGGSMDAFLLPGISVAGETSLSSDQPTHATSMFETILRGVSANGQETSVKVLPVDVYGNNAETTTFDVANGIDQAVKKGAGVINLSLGSAGDSSFLRQVIKSSTDQGVMFFAAAGNEPSTALTYPAAYSNVVAVTASGRDGTIASYANRGEFVDLAAPGSSVVSYNGQSWLVMGTSASTAYASGLAASLWNCGKSTPAQVTSAMQTILPVKR